MMSPSSNPKVKSPVKTPQSGFTEKTQQQKEEEAKKQAEHLEHLKSVTQNKKVTTAILTNFKDNMNMHREVTQYGHAAISDE